MTKNPITEFAGRMRVPMEHPETDTASMFLVSDHDHTELDLILLTAGAFSSAYDCVRKFKPKILRIFTPSMNNVFVSDVYNLQKELSKTMDCLFVYPEKQEDVVLRDAQEVHRSWTNSADSSINILYVDNPKVKGVQDIIVRSRTGSHYFSVCMNRNRLLTLFKKKTCDRIYVPKSVTLFGGLSYDKIIEMNRLYHKKVEAFDFPSILELYQYRNRPLPQERKKVLPEMPGNINVMTEEDMLALLDEDLSEGAGD